MIISLPVSDRSRDISVHRALWVLLPARAQRVLGVLRPLAAAEAPALVSRGAVASGMYLSVLMVGLQMWILLALLAVAVAITLVRRPALAERCEHEACRRSALATCAARAQRESSAQRDGLDSCSARGGREAAALAAAVPLILNFLAAACRSKIKSISATLSARIFSQQLAGAAYI